MMGMIVFVMVVACGYATVLKERGCVSEVVENRTGVVGKCGMVVGFLMVVVGLMIRMGMGWWLGRMGIVGGVYVGVGGG
ncbi:Na+/H+ antiporter NhaC family protein, partial [Siminovitchia fortis]|uniref:Na+/H+ antiporter NhaC family protein n=1 Tax=Siminovitchia fortis TaxID=254758 RepID=UPI0028CB7404